MPARKSPPTAAPPQGATTGKKRVVFKWPGAAVAEVAGTFSAWEILPMKKNGTGIFERTMYLPPGVYEYKYRVDGAWCNDPAGSEQTPNPFGSFNSVLRVS